MNIRQFFLTGFLFLFYTSLLSPLSVQATESPPIILQPGITYDTGNHDYIHEDLGLSGSAWVLGGQTKELLGWFQLVNNQTQSNGYAVLSQRLDTSETFAITGVFRSMSQSLTSPSFTNAGDGIGFFITEAKPEQILSNLHHIGSGALPVNYPSGPGLGIGGLANSYFIGRDLYRNDNGIDSYQSGNILGYPMETSGCSDAIVIRQTDSTGTLITSNEAYSSITSYPMISAPGKPYSPGVFPNILQNQQDDYMTLTWIPESHHGDYHTGLLSLSCSTHGSTDLPVHLTASATLPSTITLGVTGNTGGNYGFLSYQHTSTILHAKKESKRVIISYINSRTGLELPETPESTILTNGSAVIHLITESELHDSELLMSELLTDQNEFRDAEEYLYLIPDVEHYALDSSTISHRVDEEDSQNRIQLFYNPHRYEGELSFLFKEGSTGFLPTPIQIYGYYGEYFEEPEIPIPHGYHISSVYLSDGTQYDTLSEAMQSQIVLDDSQFFQVELEADPASIHFVYHWGKVQSRVTLPDIPALEAFTHANIPLFTTPLLPHGYYIESVSLSETQTYPTLEEALHSLEYMPAGDTIIHITVSELEISSIEIRYVYEDGSVIHTIVYSGYLGDDYSIKSPTQPMAQPNIPVIMGVYGQGCDEYEVIYRLEYIEMPAAGSNTLSYFMVVIGWCLVVVSFVGMIAAIVVVIVYTRNQKPGVESKRYVLSKTKNITQILVV